MNGRPAGTVGACSYRPVRSERPCKVCAVYAAHRFYQAFRSARLGCCIQRVSAAGRSVQWISGNSRIQAILPKNDVPATGDAYSTGLAMSNRSPRATADVAELLSDRRALSRDCLGARGVDRRRFVRPRRGLGPAGVHPRRAHGRAGGAEDTVVGAAASTHDIHRSMGTDDELRPLRYGCGKGEPVP